MKSTKISNKETGFIKILVKFSEEEMKYIRRFSDSDFPEKNIYTKKQIQFLKNIKPTSAKKGN